MVHSASPDSIVLYGLCEGGTCPGAREQIFDEHKRSKNIRQMSTRPNPTACTARTSDPRMRPEGLDIYIGPRFPVWIFSTLVWFITSIHRLWMPLTTKHSATTLTCSPCTMICFDSGLRGSVCTVEDDAHAAFSSSARLFASKRKISNPDM